MVGVENFDFQLRGYINQIKIDYQNSETVDYKEIGRRISSLLQWNLTI